jgi:hypothetical protein
VRVARAVGAPSRAGLAARAPSLAALAAGLAAIPVWIYLARDRTFAVDEWNFVESRWYGGIDSVLERHNEHIVVIPALVYRFLFETVGIDHGWPYRLVVLAMHLGCAALLFSLVRRRAGAWPAAFAAILLLFCARAAENVLQAFQMGFVGPVLGGLFAWWALDRERPVLACLGLVFGILCGSLTVAIAIGVAAELVWGRRLRWLWVPAVPLGLYALWFLGYGGSNTRREGWESAPGWAVDSAAAAAGGVLGRGLDWGRPLLLVAVALLVWRFRSAPITPRLVALVAAGAAYWILTGASRSAGSIAPTDPGQSRYVYLGAILVLLLLAEAASGWRPGRRALIALGVLTALGLAQGLPELRRQADISRGASDRVRAEATALHAVRERVPPDFTIAAGLGDLQAGPYFQAADRYGSIALPIEELASEPADARYWADPVFIAGDVRLGPAGPQERPPGNLPPPVAEGPPGTQPSVGGCVRRDGAVDVRPVTGALWLRTAQAAKIELRRFGDGFHEVGTVPAGAPSVVRIQPDGVDVPWHVRVTVPGGRTSVCSLP